MEVLKVEVCLSLFVCLFVLGNATVSLLKEDSELRKVKSAAKALSRAGNKIPEARRQELSLIVQKHFGASALAPEMISQAATMETHMENANYVSHGFEVVKRVCAEGKLLEFEKMWRKHFVDTMQPKFLPPLWSVDHRHEILKGKLTDSLDRYSWQEMLVESAFTLLRFSITCGL